MTTLSTPVSTMFFLQEPNYMEYQRAFFTLIDVFACNSAAGMNPKEAWISAQRTIKALFSPIQKVEGVSGDEKFNDLVSIFANSGKTIKTQIMTGGNWVQVSVFWSEDSLFPVAS